LYLRIIAALFIIIGNNDNAVVRAVFVEKYHGQVLYAEPFFVG